MSPRLPPLEALRYFEVAARHLNFTLAAEELCVSQSAVSQKMIQLEQRLNYRLFDRKPRQLLLTEAGEKLFSSVSQALSLIRGTLSDIDNHEQKNRLRVYCMPAFASRWFMSRLSNFHSDNPSTDLHIIAEFDEPDFHNEDVDVGIVHGVGDQPTMDQRLLFRDYIYPVASPELVEQLNLRTPEDLSRALLLHDSLPQAKLSTSWSSWANSVGVRGIDCDSGDRFNQADLIVSAAIDGRGVALGRHALVAKEIANGHLVRLFDHVIEDEGVYLVSLKKMRERQHVSLFFDWMQAQAAQFETTHGFGEEVQYYKRA